MSESFYVKGWWKLQHYADRRPLWIKLYRSIETDLPFQSLTEVEQYRLIRLWLLASDLDGQIPDDAYFIQRALRLHHRVMAVKLLAKLEAKGLIAKEDVRGDRANP